MERVSLVDALFLLFGMPFFFFLLFQRCMTKRVCLSLSVFVNSLSIYSVFLQISLVKLDLSSRSFAFAFHDSILYP